MLKFFKKTTDDANVKKQFNMSLEEYDEIISRLTDKENIVYNEVVQGFTVNEISKKLNVTKNTINSHLKVIFKKLNVHSKVELIITYGNIYNYVNDINND